MSDFVTLKNLTRHFMLQRVVVKSNSFSYTFNKHCDKSYKWKNNFLIS